MLLVGTEVITKEKKMTKFICISGKAQNGKDTTANILCDELQKSGKKTLIVHYADLLKYICKTWFGWNGVKDDAGRTILQKVGTDVVRKKRPDFWVDFILDVVELFENEWDYIIIPDTRFPNELYKIKDSGYPMTHIRVVRKDFVSPLSQVQQAHISETALDNETPDIMLLNEGTVEDLILRIQKVVKQL